MRRYKKEEGKYVNFFSLRIDLVKRLQCVAALQES